MTITVGSVVDGVVTGITKFGAFVEIEGGVTGLVHISEVANAYVREVSDCLQVNDKVRVKVINIGENGKVGLSVKQAMEKPMSSQPREEFNFEDKLARFMKESNERLVELKRHQEGKKGR